MSETAALVWPRRADQMCTWCGARHTPCTLQADGHDLCDTCMQAPSRRGAETTR